MNTKSWSWLMAAGTVIGMVSIGCSHEQTSQTASNIASNPQPEPIAQAEVKPVNPTPAMVTEKGSPSKPELDKTFVTNENLQPVYFDISQLKLDMKSQEELQKNAEWLKQNTPFMVEVAGYADTRGSMKKNRWLAEHRAAAVRDYYVSLGIPKYRIRLSGMGIEEPSCTPLTEECLAQSRRVETLVDNKTLASR